MTRDLGSNGLDRARTITSQALEQPRDIILPSASPKPTSVFSLKNPEWNTNHFSWRLTSDFTAAASASGLVAPLITIIDR